MDEWHWLGAADLARAFRQGQVCPVDCVSHLVKRIRRLDPALHVFVTLDHENALAQARKAGAELEGGRARSALHGVPVAIKDNIDVAGLPTTCQSSARDGYVARSDAEVVRKLRAAGAVILGKVATWEFAVGAPGKDARYPPARNPWKTTHSPGGSSSGSGAGLAAGLFPLAIGSDTGGSIRNPAASCGVVGLKPTYDLVSRSGLFPLAWSMDHVGPMARTVDDTRLLLDVIGGWEEKGRIRHADPDIRDMRVGFVRNFHEDDAQVAPEVAAGLNVAADVLRGLGLRVSDVRLPPLRDFLAVGETILHSEAWSVHAASLEEHPERYTASSRRKLLTGAFMRAGDYVDAQRQRVRLVAAVNDRFRDADVLLAVNSFDPAGALETGLPDEPSAPRQARIPFNVTGHPAISLMSGISSGGLPLSLQLVGRHFEEHVLMQVAAAYERATGWHRMRAPLR